METAYDRKLYDDIAEVLVDDNRLQTRVKEIAQEINADYRNVDDLLLVCVLRGAYVFLADLSRALSRPHAIDFIRTSSYGSVDTRNSGSVRIIMDLMQNIHDRHVLIVEDIVDSGRTLDYLRTHLLNSKPASLRICALLNKPARRSVNVSVDYIGFDIPDEFVVGYGLSFNQLYHNLPFIAVLKPAVFAHLSELK